MTAADSSGHALGGEVPASTGGVVDLDRIIGNIPTVLVFIETPTSERGQEVLDALGERLVDFGRDRIQLLAVSPVEVIDAMDADASALGHVRILADTDRLIAVHLGATYSSQSVETVLIGADGQVVQRWSDEPTHELAEDLLARVEGLDN
jgi:peroxiredoxin